MIAPALHGWLNVDKPLGLSSAGAVGRLKWALRQGGYGRPRIGHGGTLDPLATGVLPVALGEATKLAGHLLGGDKAYVFTVAFGTATATDDAEGAVVATSPARPTRAALLAALPAFIGDIAQVPPAYSALKIDGVRAYALARAGDAPVMTARAVRVDALRLTAFDGASATLEVDCGTGTYVRSLARDLAVAVGAVGHVSMLRRTRAGPFDATHAIVLDKLVELAQTPALEQAMLPLTAGLDDIPVLNVDTGEANALRQGRVLPRRPQAFGLHLATTGSVPVALVDVGDHGVRVVRGFNL